MDRITLRENVLKDNQRAAAENRLRFEREGTLVVNVMSAPGAGKTSLLEATLRRLHDRYRVAVIEGDLQTDLDSQRIRSLGVRSHQITTGTVCHLDARMIARALAELPIEGLDLLIVENVGNLICPAAYDLGEDFRVVLASAAEGAEKPRKYPVMFHKADVVLVNKSDLAEMSGVDLAELERNVREVNPKAMVLTLSCRTGEGLESWVEWVRTRIEARKTATTKG